MISKCLALLAIAALPSVFSLSSTCEGGLASLALGDSGSCLQLTSLLPVLSASGSLAGPINSYLTSLCASSTPTCSNSTLSSAQSTLTTACSSDLSSGGSDAAEIEGFMAILLDYPQFYAGACSKNTTTGDYCVTDALNTVQSDTNTNVTLAFVTGFLSPANDTAAVGPLQQAFQTGNLCTGCVAAIYQQALSANASVAQTPIAQALVSKCGASFSTTPSGVSSAAPSATSSASTTSSSAVASSGAALVRLDVSKIGGQLGVGAIAMVITLIVGSALAL